MIGSARRSWLGLAGWAAVLAVLLLLPGNVPRGTQEILLNLLLWIGIAQAWNLIGGIGGQLSLGHSVFVGAGGYTLAMSVLKAGMPWPAALLFGGVLSGALAWLLSYPLLRLSGVYFTIGSSAVALIAQAWMVTWTWTGESRGLNIPLDAVPSLATTFQVIAVLAVLACVVTSVVLRSTFGLRLMAVRDNEGAAAALGVSTRSVKRQALVLSAFLTGLLGGAVAINQAFIEPNSMFGLDWVVTALVMVVVGGMGTVAGPIIGAFVIYYLLDRALESQPVLQALLTGVLVIAVIVVAPNGIVGVLRAGMDAVANRLSRRRPSEGSTANRQRVSIAARSGSPPGWPGEERRAGGPRGDVELAERLRGVQQRGGEQMNMEVAPSAVTPSEQAREIPAALIDQPPSGGPSRDDAASPQDRPTTPHAARPREGRNT